MKNASVVRQRAERVSAAGMVCMDQGLRIGEGLGLVGVASTEATAGIQTGSVCKRPSGF